MPPGDTLRRCYRCKTSKPLDDFHKNISKRGGVQGYCKACANVATTCSRYRLSWEEYQVMIAGGCDICGTHQQLHIDHDHNCCSTYPLCGQCTRGVLCRKHNYAVAYYEQNEMEKIREYVESFEGNR